MPVLLSLDQQILECICDTDLARCHVFKGYVWGFMGFESFSDLLNLSSRLVYIPRCGSCLAQLNGFQAHSFCAWKPLCWISWQQKLGSPSSPWSHGKSWHGLCCPLFMVFFFLLFLTPFKICKKHHLWGCYFLLLFPLQLFWYLFNIMILWINMFSPLYYIATLTLTLWQPPPWKLAKARVDDLLCQLVHHLSSVINFLWFGFVIWLYSLSLTVSVYTLPGPRKAESIISIKL